MYPRQIVRIADLIEQAGIEQEHSDPEPLQYLGNVSPVVLP